MFIQTPPMGWNSWNTFGTNISDALIRETADAMVESGLRDAGYEYLVIDDCWLLRDRDDNGKLVPDPEKFPHGMKALADYVHSKGLKFGMYSCNGTMTCAVCPSSFDYEFQDAKQFAEWGVDFLKYDNCNRPNNFPGRLLYKRMGLALANCGRDILFSACNWGADNSPEWIKETGAHMWRSTGDIVDSWASIKDLTMKQYDLLKTNGQGCFNDMDMLVVGMRGKGNVGVKDGCTDDEYRTHFSIWAFFGSPLMIGCDIREMSEETKAILTNRELIRLNQDRACRQPFPVNHWMNDIWVRFLEDGDIAIAFFNLFDDPHRPDFSLADIGLGGRSGKALQLTDLWTGENVGTYADHYWFPLVPPHGCQVLRGKIVDA